MITLLKQDSFSKALMLVGLETDTKPTEYFTFKGAVLPIRNGSTFYEADTATFYIYDGDSGTWLEQSGGGYPEPTGTVQITQNGTGIDIKDYAEADVAVPNTYGVGDEGKVVDNGALVSQTSKNIGANGTVDTTKNNEVVVSVPNTYVAADEGKVVSNGGLVSQSQRSITSNGTVDTTLNNECVVAVPNTYAAGDEGKVVENGSLVAQSSQSIAANGTYDTTKKNEVVVNVPSQDNAGGLIDGSISGVLYNSDATKIRNYAFYNMNSLEEIHLPNCLSVSNQAFYSDTSPGNIVKVLDLPRVTSTGLRSFYKIGNALVNESVTVNLPLVENLGEYTFSSSKVGPLSLPRCKSIGQEAFSYCWNLTEIDLGYVGENGEIRGHAFMHCQYLTALIIRNTNSIFSLANIYALSNTPIASGTGYIYVPQALKSTYEAATNWVTYASQFRSLEDYTVDGTTTGALDPSKI